jgi:hypothetical protein
MLINVIAPTHNRARPLDDAYRHSVDQWADIRWMGQFAAN